MYRGHEAAAATSVSSISPSYRPAYNSMDVEFTQLSDVGRVRQGNEDYAGFVAADTPERARSQGWLFALADGVGGHDLGEVRRAETDANGRRNRACTVAALAHRSAPPPACPYALGEVLPPTAVPSA